MVPTVIGASRLMLLEAVGDERKLAVTPAPLGTCAGVVQLLAVLQLPPPARFHADPKFGAASTKALSWMLRTKVLRRISSESEKLLMLVICAGDSEESFK